MQAFCNNSSHFHMKDCSPPLPKRKLGSPNTEGLQENRNFASSWLHNRKKIKPPQKIFVGGVGLYHVKKGYKYRLPPNC